MTVPNNERGSNQRLPVVLLGDGERLSPVVAAAAASGLIEIVAQSGMTQAAALPNIPWQNDPRVLLADVEATAAVLAGSTRADLAAADLALERGLHVWRLPPLARSFGESCEVLGRAARPGLVYRVASWWEHVVDHAWGEIAWPEGFRPLLSELRLAQPAPAEASWRISISESGGGALAAAAYGLCEVLVATRNLPERVFAATRVLRRATPAVTREAEDSASALLEYVDGGLAAVTAAWGVPPTQTQLLHHGANVSAQLTGDGLSLLDPAGTVLDHRPLPTDWLVADMQRFVALVRGSASDRAAVTLERHLAVSALLEAIYLSSQTHHPESPLKFYDVQGRTAPRA